MKFSSLGSGSSGNSSYIEMGNKKFLIDAGFSGKKIVEKLNNIEKRIEDVMGIFVTHEHSDHIQGLGVISRKYDIPIYLHEVTYNVIKDRIGKIEKKNLNFIRDEKIVIDNCVINNFEVMHDAEKCLGYTFEYEGKKLSYASDVGCVNNIIKENLKNSDVIVLESNYDYNMLMTGPYHWELKNRVKGRNGHLSNSEASKLIGQVLSEKLKKVYLMHISKDNNTPELAYNSLYQILERENKSHLEIEIINEEGTEIYKI
ncbi:MBL fold metallo-hydrolase [Leptotrichia hongkongensis]|uniref:MBL fold metallo-hydrolase n=1 Tax=Leptotrichia hongkongensis TaxID=554406 RepID=UPI0035A8EEA8